MNELLKGAAADRQNWRSAWRRARPLPVLAVASALLASGCTTLLPEAAPTVYDLSGPAQIDVGARSTSRQLLVAEPAAVRFYATDRVVVRDTGATLSYYPGALWSDALPELFQARFAETLERTGRARAVGRPGQGLLIDTRLVPEIRAFEVAIGEGGTAVAVVDVSLKVMNDANGRILATRDFIVEVPAASDSADDGIAALNEAADAVLVEMTRFVLDAV
ncbi:MAG: membrane integrity-associated transporter subunit PqiC [Devosiaceae bacterium]|nr:membrane integrity-associated transporter subunit PqiC [Devosiaceae bacterium MH13]